VPPLLEGENRASLTGLLRQLLLQALARPFLTFSQCLCFHPFEAKHPALCFFLVLLPWLGLTAWSKRNRTTSQL